jgi:serine/threonine protein phosphatase PrpC
VKLPPTAEFDVALRSNVGRVRTSNQDEVGEGARPHGHWFVVADGMGGHAGGATASRIAVETLLLGEGGGTGTDEKLGNAFRAANSKIHQTGIREARLAGMGTTAVALAFEHGKCWVGNVGDSRAYRLRGSTLLAITGDHSVVAEFERQGHITNEQARAHPRRNELMRSLGTSREVDVDVDPIDAAPGDTFMLCSDGLHGVVNDEAIAGLLAPGTAQEATDALISAANTAGGPDNISVLVIRIPGPRVSLPRLAGIAILLLGSAMALWALR